MKRFDLASEVAKQLITIASAIITVVIVFYEKFFSHENLTFFAVFFILLIFIVSILAGVLSIGGVTTLVEAQEDNDWQLDHPPPAVAPAAAFTNLNGTWAQTFAKCQQGLFVFGLFLFLAVGIADRVCGSSPATKSPNVQVHP
jgi:hypothetical protein